MAAWFFFTVVGQMPVQRSTVTVIDVVSLTRLRVRMPDDGRVRLSDAPGHWLLVNELESLHHITRILLGDDFARFIVDKGPHVCWVFRAVGRPARRVEQTWTSARKAVVWN